jgi:hypothetical protein
MQTIHIDPEFQSLLQPLSEDEYALLEANILEDGCREPIVLWNDIIIDGHNRYSICCNQGLQFRTVNKEFADRQAAMDWIDKNQLGRRNLTPDQMSLIRGRRYNRLKMTPGKPKKQCGQNAHIGGLVRDRIAAEHGVDSTTIGRDAKFATALEQLPEVAQQVKEGQKVVRKDVIEAAKAIADGDTEQAERILDGKGHLPKVEPLKGNAIADQMLELIELAKTFDKHDRAILDVQKEVLDNVKAGNPAYQLIVIPFFKSAIRTLRENLMSSRPTSLCPKCNGEKCVACRQRGFIGKAV